MLKLAFLLWTVVLASSEFNDPSFHGLSLCQADRDEDWTYRGRKGPAHWGDIGYPVCNEMSQSPIEINSASAVKDENLAQLVLDNYDTPVSEATLRNDGHTIEVVPTDGVDRTISVNGGTYSLQQLHFHWGKTFFRGSEHVLDGVHYQMELHFVHTNASGGIAVVGIFFREQFRPNDDLKPIVDELRNLRFKGQNSSLNSELNLNNLLPSNPTSFYRYEGSLTTPDCSEGVTWSVVPRPMKVGVKQMLEFRKLFSAPVENATIFCPLAGNYRPVQPLNERPVFLSQ